MSIRINKIPLNNSNNTNTISNSDDEQSSSINNNNSNDCNLLLNDKSKNHPDTSIFDDSSLLATVSEMIFLRSFSLLIERHICLSYSISSFSLFHLVVLLLLAAEEKYFFLYRFFPLSPQYRV